MNSLAEFFRTLGPARLAAMATVAAITIGFFIFLSIRLSTPNMSLLFSGLDLSDSAKIVQNLEAQGIPYKLVGDGNTILVPHDQVNKIRVNVAGQGLNSGGSLGYELFDRGDSLGTTSFVQNINLIRALEGELSRTIQAIEKVTSARIHLVLPQRRLFSNEDRQATASIFVKTSNGRLSRDQVMAIQNLVSGAVPDLQPERISIVDQKGSLLAHGTSDNTASALALSLDEKKNSMENRLRGQIEDLLEKTVGLGKVRTEVNAELDMNRITSNSETYDPEGTILSSQTTESTGSDVENADESAVSVANNLPGDAPQADEAPGIKNQSNSSNTSETINYKISKTLKTQIHEAGTIKKISVAVLVDGIYTDAAGDGVMVYQPRDPQELQQLEELVKSAMGYDEERGDSVSIVNLQFAPIDYGEEVMEEGLFEFSNKELRSYIMDGIFALVALLLIFFAIRPLIAFLTSPPSSEQQAALAAAGVGAMPGQAQLPPGMPQPAAEQQAIPAPQQQLQVTESGNYVIPTNEQGVTMTAHQVAAEQGLEAGIDVAAVEGKIQATALKKVGELVERHPDESVAVIRSWLYG